MLGQGTWEWISVSESTYCAGGHWGGWWEVMPFGKVERLQLGPSCGNDPVKEQLESLLRVTSGPLVASLGLVSTPGL